MFDNIHEKIKTLAKVIALIGIIVSCISGFMTISSATHYLVFLVGIIKMIGGSLLSWIGSFIPYGFGEIIELLIDIRDSAKQNAKESNSNEI